MGLFNFIKNNKKTVVKTDTKYSDILPKAMKVFYTADNDVQTELLKIAGDSLELAEQLYWFFPSILFKLLFPEVQYVDSYSYSVIYNNGNERVFSYSKNKLYQEIKVYVESNFQTLNQQQLLSVLSHSAEFNAVNKALLHNNGSKLENLVCYSLFMSNLE